MRRTVLSAIFVAKKLMTAIITKQNAKDKDFINSDVTGGDYPKDAVFDSIEAQTIICDSITAQTIDCDTVNKEAAFTGNDEQITFANHESRMKEPEQSGSGDSSLAFSSRYPEIVITKNLTENDSNNTHTLTLNIDKNIYE